MWGVKESAKADRAAARGSEKDSAGVSAVWGIGFRG